MIRVPSAPGWKIDKPSHDYQPGTQSLIIRLTCLTEPAARHGGFSRQSKHQGGGEGDPHGAGSKEHLLTGQINEIDGWVVKKITTHIRREQWVDEEKQVKKDKR